MPHHEIISDPATPAAQRISDLAKPARGVPRSALIEDVEPLAQALRAGVEFDEVYGDAGREIPEDMARLCAEQGVPIRLIEPALLTKLFRTEKRPRLFGVAKVPAPARFSALSAAAGDVVVLDGVRIVGNIGAIIRSAVAFGVRGVILVDSELSTITDRRLVRASRGYVFSVPVLLETRERTARWLSDSGLGVVDVDVHGSLTPAELAADPADVALLLGAEKTGASDALQALATRTIQVPIAPEVESLNVSVTAGIVLFSRAQGRTSA